MATLTNEQIEFIKNDLKDRSLSRSFLYQEFLDHLCSDVENQMDKGMEFEQAYVAVSRQLDVKELQEAHSETLHLLNYKYVLIKKLLYLAVILYALSWLINIPKTANWISLASFMVLSAVYLKLSLDFFRERHRTRINIMLSLFTLLSFLGTLSGIILIFLTRYFNLDTHGHGVDLTVFAWFFFSVVCLIHYTQEYRTSIETSGRKKNKVMIWIVAINLFLAVMSIATFPLYNLVSGYIFYLIIVILTFDMAVLVMLLVQRKMRNTLMVTLILGSFMIVFIHSHVRNRLPGGQPKMYTITVNINQEEATSDEILYFYMYYDQFREYKFTIPIRSKSPGLYSNSWPSYRYKGYLIYMTGRDSIDANQAFIEQFYSVDSIFLDIPKEKTYNVSID